LFTSLERFCQNITEAVTSIAPDEQEAPRAQPAVVGRPQPSRENLIEIGVRRSRFNEAKGRDTADQGGEYRRFMMP
jgi:hypothetical protein